MADLAHDPFDVEVVGDERDGNLGATQGVRRDVREWREAAGFVAAAGLQRRFANESADALVVEAAAGSVRDNVVATAVREASASEPIEVIGDGAGECRGHLRTKRTTQCVSGVSFCQSLCGSACRLSCRSAGCRSAGRRAVFVQVTRSPVRPPVVAGRRWLTSIPGGGV